MSSSTIRPCKKVDFRPLVIGANEKLIVMCTVGQECEKQAKVANLLVKIATRKLAILGPTLMLRARASKLCFIKIYHDFVF